MCFGSSSLGGGSSATVGGGGQLSAGSPTAASMFYPPAAYPTTPTSTSYLMYATSGTGVGETAANGIGRELYPSAMSTGNSIASLRLKAKQMSLSPSSTGSGGAGGLGISGSGLSPVFPPSYHSAAASASSSPNRQLQSLSACQFAS